MLWRMPADTHERRTASRRLCVPPPATQVSSPDSRALEAPSGCEPPPSPGKPCPQHRLRDGRTAASPVALGPAPCLPSAPEAQAKQSEHVMDVRSGFIASTGNTPLIKLIAASKATGCNIYGKAEFLNPGGSVKDRAALAIIEDAE